MANPAHAFGAYLVHFWEARSLYRIHSPLFFRILSTPPPVHLRHSTPYAIFLRRLTEAVGPLPCIDFPNVPMGAPNSSFVAMLPDGAALYRWQRWRRGAPGVVVTFPRMGIHIVHPLFKQHFSLPLYPPGWYPGCRS